MRRPLALVFALALAGSAAADGLLLKDGRKFSGKVQEKADGFEITVEGQLLGFGKDEVERWVKSPKELTGDAQKLYDEAKAIYQEAVEIKDDKAAEARFREALPKVQKARESYAEARDLFPDGYSELDTELVKIMKLMRLVRERIGSSLASPAAAVAVKPKEAPPPPPKTLEPAPEAPKVEAASSFSQAFAVLGDPAKRADPAQREAARGLFRKSADAKAPIADVAVAAWLFLSRSDAAWGLAKSPEALAALQDFFRKLDGDKLETLDEKAVGDAVAALAAKGKELRGKGADVDALALFAAGSSSALLSKNSEAFQGLEAAFRDLGYEKSDVGSLWGTKAGLAMDDYRKWVASGEYGLAVVQFQSDYRSLSDFPVRYAHGLLSVFKALADKRGYSLSASILEVLSRSAPSKAAAEHAAALAKSIRSEAPCPACGGAHEVNCSACKGKQKLNLQCGGCGGSGKVNTFNGVKSCLVCKGAGGFKNVDCPKCKAKGKVPCKARHCDKAVGAPTFESFAEAYRCRTCAGKGGLLKHVAFSCPDCSGVGLIIQPKADPSKLLR